MTTNCGCCRAEPVIIRGGRCGPVGNTRVFLPACSQSNLLSTNWSGSPASAGNNWTPGTLADCSALGPYPPDLHIDLLAGLPYTFDGTGGTFTDSTDPRRVNPMKYLRLSYVSGCIYRSAVTSQEVYENGPGPWPVGWPHGSGTLLGTTVYYYELDFSAGIGDGQTTLKRFTLSHPDPDFPPLVTWVSDGSLTTQSAFRLVITGANETLYAWRSVYTPPLIQRPGEYPCKWVIYAGQSHPLGWCFQVDATIRGNPVSILLDLATDEVSGSYASGGGTIQWIIGTGQAVTPFVTPWGTVEHVRANVAWSWSCDGVAMSVSLLGDTTGSREAAYSGSVGYRWFESSSGALPATGVTSESLNEAGDTATVTIVSCGSGSGSGSGGGGGLSDEECWDLAESLDDVIESFMASQGMEPCEVEYDPDDYNTIIAQVICNQIQRFLSQCAGTEAYDWFVDKWGVP